MSNLPDWAYQQGYFIGFLLSEKNEKLVFEKEDDIREILINICEDGTELEDEEIITEIPATYLRINNIDYVGYDIMYKKSLDMENYIIKIRDYDKDEYLAWCKALDNYGFEAGGLFFSEYTRMVDIDEDELEELGFDDW